MNRQHPCDLQKAIIRARTLSRKSRRRLQRLFCVAWFTLTLGIGPGTFVFCWSSSDLAGVLTCWTLHPPTLPTLHHQKPSHNTSHGTVEENRLLQGLQAWCVPRLSVHLQSNMETSEYVACKEQVGPHQNMQSSSNGQFGNFQYQHELVHGKRVDVVTWHTLYSSGHSGRHSAKRARQPIVHRLNDCT